MKKEHTLSYKTSDMSKIARHGVTVSTRILSASSQAVCDPEDYKQ